MYSKFNYKPGDYFYSVIQDCEEEGEKLYKNYKQKAEKSLNDFLLKNGKIDGTALQDYWFGNIEADVFLSHSHKDKDDVIAFAGWLKREFGLTSFIDSCVWGYCDDLLKKIDDQYCKIEGKSSYYYESRNCTTSHVHAMLSSALSQMIDKTECIIFFNTPQSIVLDDEIKERTYSQWLYYELSMTKYIKTSIPERLIGKYKAAMESLDNKWMLCEAVLRKYSPEYDVEKYLGDMDDLDDDILFDWSDGHNPSKQGKDALDELYELCRLKQK